MKRANPYEAALEAWLLGRRVPYVAVDETRRSLLGGQSLKSLDFLLTSSQGVTWLVDVKGRRFSGGRAGRYWKNWTTLEDVRGLAQWECLLGAAGRGLFVFAYEVRGDRAPVAWDELFLYRDRLYAFLATPVAEYAQAARLLSPRWGTVCMPAAQFRRLARPLAEVLAGSSAATPSTPLPTCGPSWAGFEDDLDVASGAAERLPM